MSQFDDDEGGFWATRFALGARGLEALRQRAANKARQAYDATTRQIATAGDAARRVAADAEQGVDRFKAGAQAQMDRLMSQKAAEAKRPVPDLPLRGMLPAPPVPAARPQPGGYYADLSHPSQIPFMTTSVAGDPSHSYVDPHPAANLGRRIGYDQLRDGVRGLAAGQPVDPGPTISFVNDQPRNPSPYQPLTTDTARMVAAGFLQSGASAMNINSTTGGTHGGGSRHYTGQAVDINSVNGVHVSPAHPARAMQDAYFGQPNVREDLGPSYLMNNKGAGRVLFRSPRLERDHKPHIHISGTR